MEECLAESFNIFIEYSLNLLKRHRDIFPPSNKIAFHRLEGMLRCLTTIYNMKVFKKTCPFIKDMHPEITHVIKKGTLEWYERQATTCRSLAKREDDNLQSLLDLTNTLNTEIYMALHYFDKVFQEHVNVGYFHIVYRHLDKVLGDELHQDLKTILRDAGCDKEIKLSDIDENTAVGTSLFELYLAIQEFTKYSSHLTPKDRQGLNISQYFEWFRCAVSRWLCIARQKSLKRIKKAVELDKVAQMDMSVKYSTSAVDVCCCFVQITDFWKQLSWPDYVGAFPFVNKLTEDICKGAELYADLVHEKLIKAGYYDEEGQFDVTEQLCITINNIEQVRRALNPLPDTLNFSEIKKAIEMSNGEHKQEGQSLNNIIKRADDMMVKKITQVVDRVADKMRPDIKKDVFHLNWAPESVPADDAIGDLLEYLDTNLLTLNNNLLKTNFDRILESIWVEVMEEFQEVMEKEEVRPPVFYQRMFDALGVLVDFFHASGKGLSMDEIITDQFQNLRERLSLHKMDTPTLIETFFNSKCQDQTQLENSEFGILNVRVCYRMDAHTLLVEVLSAKDIIPLDANGLSDPFVLVQLVPEHVFPNIQVQTTKVVKKTLNPLFEETFEFTINPIQCQRHGATLLFTVMDHDLVFQNDFAGEAYLSMAEIPGVDGLEVSGYEALSIVSLPLMHPKHKGMAEEDKRKKKLNRTSNHAALEILGRRTWDKDAQDFVKKRNKVHDQAASSIP
ncbi:BAI1-associated protein 3 [Patella vulgata]|uniref:BAI1-associated protein 3 n=1 Tax=Patella vulgata TaxID=6465 RepID=UPI0024A7C967|nr:BAI1-associated protein 3 [Patella vulgata]